MITFLPSLNFDTAAQMLDNRRLTNQLGEARLIMEILLSNRNTRWYKHPVVDMWKDYEPQLFFYSAAIHQEMLNRGYKTSANWTKLVELCQRLDGFNTFVRPHWFKYEDRIVTTHRANLYKKRPDLYSQFKEEFETYQKMVCCFKTTKRPGRVTGPCQYFWPSHYELGVLTS